MNIQELDLLNIIKNDNYNNQRELSQKSGYSLGKVNASIKELMSEGYIDKNLLLTEKADQLWEESKPKKAVILAAGPGMRMVPINVEVPKGLLEVKGEPLVERLIRQLHEVNITDIQIIVGFMKEQYEYLIDKYNVDLIFNADYSSKNNLFSLAKAKGGLKNTYIIPCDIWCRHNPFSETELYPWYMVTDQTDEDSTVRINRKRELKMISDNEEGNRMIGIAYICEEDEYVGEQIKKMTANKRYKHAFWEESTIRDNKMVLWPKLVGSDEVFEINTIEELRELDENSNNLNSDVLDIAANAIGCDVKEIVEIEALKKGMTNRSFRFRCRDKRYIMRIPGEGTGKMINRMQEYAVYQVVGKEDICDPICYMSPDNGYKITEFLENARVCDPENMDDVKKCMEYLREMHKKELKVDHVFDIFQQIEQYESYWQGEKSVYRDYDETKKHILELKSYIDAMEKAWTLTHIDAVPDNFLFVNDRMYLIDWEYSGMQDPHVDIAMFIIYAMYERAEADAVIDAYFDGKCPENIRTKIYCYVAMCGLLWSNWCEYKRICGVEFGEYSIRQYRYAKEYYKIVKGRLEDE